MPHVEFSVSGPHLMRPRRPVESSLDRWALAVAGATEPSLVIDADMIVVALSPSFEELLGLPVPAVGRGLLDEVLELLDFADGAQLAAGEIGKIPPLLAISSGRLARGLLRVRCAQNFCTLDAVATPVAELGVVTGSLTFFSLV